MDFFVNGLFFLFYTLFCVVDSIIHPKRFIISLFREEIIRIIQEEEIQNKIKEIAYEPREKLLEGDDWVSRAIEEFLEDSNKIMILREADKILKEKQRDYHDGE